MTPLPAALHPAAPLVAWRIDAERFGTTWDSGIGAELMGGRWNPKGLKTVYCSIDPSTSLVESAVHCGFKVLDSSAHVITSFEILEPKSVRVVMPGDIPNPAWLRGGTSHRASSAATLGTPLPPQQLRLQARAQRTPSDAPRPSHDPTRVRLGGGY